jgi:hypothetical protein
MMTETFNLPFVLTNGNDGRGSKWFRSAAVRDRIEGQLRLLGLVRSPWPYRVRCRVVRVLGKGERLWDDSSVLRGNWKEIEDALVACGWFNDDGPKWISAVDGRQDDTRRHEGPKIELTVTRDDA